jgi:ADP-heptose:LPS heptosyltransferase
LVDHARFALGDSLSRFEETVHARPTVPDHRSDRPVAPLRVLFHLNGGWKLKTYPAQHMRTIIAVLRGLGVEATVIDRPDLKDAGAQSVISEDSATLRRLVEEHHLFVGVDSFPHHFARLVMGWPTLGLFGNTKPCNSDALYGVSYRSSDQSLSCNRCGAYDTCPALGRQDCINYAPPERVVADILDLAGAIYGYSPVAAR